MQFIEDYLRLTDEQIVDKLEKLLRNEMKKAYKSSLKPMTEDELRMRVEEAEEDYAKGRVMSHQQVKTHFRNRQAYL